MAVDSALTLDQFLGQEDTKPASEYACGEAVQKPMPNRLHSALQMYLGVVLFQFLERTKLGHVLPEFRCIFGPSGRERAYVADLCYVAKGRLTADLHLHAAPDIAIEILSPAQDMARLLTGCGKTPFRQNEIDHRRLHYVIRRQIAVTPESARDFFRSLLDKIQFYLLKGVRLIWVLDPAAATIAVLTPGEEARTLRSGDSLDASDVLPGFSVPVADIFARLVLDA